MSRQERDHQIIVTAIGLKPGDAAAAAGCSERVIRAARARGELRVAILGNGTKQPSWVVLTEDLRDWLLSKREAK